jgi:hypothetical protein
VTMKNAVFWNIKKNLVRTSHETHYVSATEPSRLRFSRRWLWRMPSSRIQNLIRTSQETYYVSATKPSLLMLCKISGFHGGEYEECCLLLCYEVWLF